MVAATVRISVPSEVYEMEGDQSDRHSSRGLYRMLGLCQVNAPLKPLISRRISRCIGSCKRMASLCEIKRDQRAKIEDRIAMKRNLTLLSHAKVNLRLEILKKREDGYHEIRTIFQKISLHDTIRFSLKEAQGISITTNEPDLPVGKSNLVYRAAQAILNNSAYRGGISIHIEKRIPLGAGLGGGSSNAATTLKALNHLLEMGLSQKEMMTMGVKIGADVPFFFLKEGRHCHRHWRTAE